jgi:hypothetical protein
MTKETAPPQTVGSNLLLGPLLDDWADAAGTCFVEREGGPVTYGSVRRNDLEQLVCAAVAAERERCATILKTRAEKIAAEAERAAASEPDEVSALRAMAWQLTVAEREILGA